jgi:hypothetical protein
MSTIREMAEALEQKDLAEQVKYVSNAMSELLRDAADVAKFANDSADLDAIHYGIEEHI